MNRKWFFRVIIVLGVFATFLYSYVAHHNRVLQLQLEIPKLAKEVREIEQDNIRLRFQIQKFEDPYSLMSMLSLHSFRHLDYATSSHIQNIKVSPWPYSPTIDNTFVSSGSSSWVNSLGAIQPN